MLISEVIPLAYLGFGSSKREEQMSQWAQSPKMAGFFYTFLWEDF